MKDSKHFSKPQIITYWFFILLAPFSLLTVTMGSPPVFVWILGTLAVISAFNRLRFSQLGLLKYIAGFAFVLYSGALGLLFYDAIIDFLIG
ncbi:MAG: hypothetical protein KAH08_01880 [Methylococcales bacterium]|nr:hypothetical protein [Methylococcales bacterium]MCK5898528.1 hypothetical protein [Methylococcales bacterium]